ncbi:hypothetical protein HDU76_002205 [Blyttiomyces sp. JEL0837]|nr:hypothetical protein HDU76_002205 [Blyttiomyces sp. JEL0837]
MKVNIHEHRGLEKNEHQKIPITNLSSEGLDFAVRMVNTAFENGIYWPLEGLLSILPNLESELLYACTVYCIAKLDADENVSNVWSPTQLKICEILLSLLKNEMVLDFKSSFEKHLANDQYDVVELFWPYVYSQRDLNAGIIKYDLVEFIAQTSTTVNKINFLLKLGINTCKIPYQEPAPFLETMLSAVFEWTREDEIVETVERLLACGANPMEAVVPNILDKQDTDDFDAEREADRLKRVVDVLICAGINLQTNMYDSPLGRSLCKQYEDRFTNVVDYLIEKGGVDVFEVVKAVLWISNPPDENNEELLERAIEVSVIHGHDHILNLFTKSDLNILTGRHVVLTVKHSQIESVLLLLNAGVRPTSNETYEIISDVLSRTTNHKMPRPSLTRIFEIFLDQKLFTPIELFEIIARSCCACGDRLINWHSIHAILLWMSNKGFFKDGHLQRSEAAFNLLTTSIENLQDSVTTLCLELKFGEGRTLPAIENIEES